MDANNQKTLAGAFVALLVGAVFLAAVPVASAQVTSIPNPTTAIDAGIDVNTRGTIYLGNETLTVTTGNGTVSVGDISPVSLPSAQKLRYNTSYDLTFVNIYTGAGSYGYTGGVTEVRLVNPSGTPKGTTTLYPQGCGSGSSLVCNATFANFNVDATGTWQLQTSGGATVANFFVYPSEAITVALSPNSLAYTSTASLFTITATNASGPVNGGIVTSDVPGYLGSSSTTNPSGVYQFFQSPPGAGNFNFYVSQDFGGVTAGGLDLPENRGTATLSVTALGIDIAAGNGTAFVGFSTTIAFRPTVGGQNVFATTAPSGFNGYNVSVVTPGNSVNPGTGSYMFIANASATSGSFGGTVNLLSGLTCHNLSASNGVCVNPPTPQVFQIVNGEVQFAPGEDTSAATNVWASGTYTFTVGLNTAGTLAATAPEYQGTYSLVPSTPAAVNLAFTTGNTTTRAGTLDVLTATGTPAPGRYVLNLYINGTSAFEHPACRNAAASCTNPGDDVSQAAFVNNITLRGDVLPDYTVTSYVASTGIATIAGVAPTKNGTLYIDVVWKNVTTTLAIPIYKGAVTTLSANNLTVDTVSTLRVTVTDAFGNPQPGATVQIFRRNGGTPDITGTTTIVGTGQNTTVGQNGLYEFNIRPNSIADYVVYTSIQNGANFSYANFSVIPAQDLTVTITPTAANAGQNTNYLLNVTNATGIGATTTNGNFRVYLLNASQRTNLLNNGTSSVITAGGLREVRYVNNSAVSANVTLELDAGTYYVWVCQSPSAIANCAAATHDNRQNMPTVTVTAYTATFNPAQVASSTTIQGATVVNVRVSASDGSIANGTLTMVANSSLVSGGTSVTITNGEGNITLTGTNTGIGNIAWSFNPDERSNANTSGAYSPVIGTLSVSAGNLTFQPARVPILQSTLITVRLTNFTGTGLPGREIRVCGVSVNANFPSSFPTTLDATNRSNCPALGVTESDGSTGIVVTPTSLSSLGVYINDSYTGRTIPVTAGTLSLTVSPLAPVAGGNVTFTVTQPGGTPSVGARILVVRDGTTVLDVSADGNGQATLSSLVSGNYTATAIRTGFDNGTASFSIGAAPSNETGAVFVLSNLTTPTTITVGTPFDIGVTVRNTGNASGTATALLFVNGQQRGSESVTLAAGASQNLLYDNIAITAAGTYTIVVRIGNVEIGPNTITVGGANATTPVTTTVGTTTPATTTTPVVTSPSVTSPVVTSPATVTTPDTNETPTEEEPSVPGFEVVALLAALGVALLVLRRRN